MLSCSPGLWRIAFNVSQTTASSLLQPSSKLGLDWDLRLQGKTRLPSMFRIRDEQPRSCLLSHDHYNEMSDPTSKQEQLWQNSIYISAFLFSLLSEVFRKCCHLTLVPLVSLQPFRHRQPPPQTSDLSASCSEASVFKWRELLRSVRDLGILFNFIEVKWLSICLRLL